MRATQWLRDRWFIGGINFFGACALVALTIVALSEVPPVTALGLVTLASAVLGLTLSAVAVRVLHPLQWRGLVARVQWVLHRCSRYGARSQKRSLARG